MIVNVYCPRHDMKFSSNVTPNLSVKDFKRLCAKQCGISHKDLKLFHNNELLNKGNQTLEFYRLYNYSMVLMDTLEDIDVFYDSKSDLNVSSLSDSSVDTRVSHLDADDGVSTKLSCLILIA